MKKKILLFSRKHSVTPIDERFIITVKTDNAGTSASNQFTIPTNTTGITQAFNYDIETSDGQTITGNSGNTTITFPSAGTYDIYITGSFPYIKFDNGGDKAKLLDIKNFGIYALGSTSQERAFRGCSNMVISATDSGNFGDVTNFTLCWQACTSLTSFPLIDTSSGTSFQSSWLGCSSLTSFPLLDTSSGTNFGGAWSGCNSLTSFPLIDTSNGTAFQSAWRNCSNLTSFPLIDTSSSTRLDSTWQSCTSLASFPSNAFDSNIATNYNLSFTDTSLTTQSIDDILVSLDTSGVSNGTFTQSGGQAPSATGEAAIDSLVGKGWTITVTGGYIPPQLLLDEYPNAAAAYSLRELSTAFVGQPVVRVRRSSDNTEQDFTATEITDGTLTTFTGANDGFVTTWYDQSGNSNNAVQNTVTLQPKLVTNGVLELENGKPCFIFNPLAVNYLQFSSINGFAFYGVGKSGTSTFERFLERQGGICVRAKSGVYDGSPDTFDWYNNGELWVNNINGLIPNPAIASNVQNLVVAYASTGSTISPITRISGESYSTRYWRGTMQEIICYTEINNPVRLDIQNNINDHYTIY